MKLRKRKTYTPYIEIRHLSIESMHETDTVYLAPVNQAGERWVFHTPEAASEWTKQVMKLLPPNEIRSIGTIIKEE